MNKWWLKVIASLEMLGGIIGIIFVVAGMFISDINNIYTIGLGVLSINVFCLSLIAGIALWREHYFGKNLSVIVQLIQLPKILSPNVIFFFSFGFDFYVIWAFKENFSHLMFNAKLLAEHRFMISVADVPFGIGISIISCIFLVLLLRVPSKKKRELG